MFHRPLGCTAAAVLPKQGSGTSQIEVNPTQVHQEMGHPVFNIQNSKSGPEPVLVGGGGSDAEGVEADVSDCVGELGRPGGEAHGRQLEEREGHGVFEQGLG